jgi:pyrroloquinoline quinone biosynthesis protein B
MRIRVLGSAAGGGLPQWNCACAHCAEARRTGAHRTQDCVAVSGDGRAWYLLNASPDLRVQLLAAPELAPGPGPRETPVRGVLLSSAELDHTLGLPMLREAGSLAVYATAPVLTALSPLRAMIDAYTRCAWYEVVPGRAFDLDGGLSVEAVVVGAKRPRYATAMPGDAWVVAYRITDGRSSFVYAPCLPAWAPSIVEGADLVLLDGTFAHEDEMRRATGRDAPASGMGHLPMEVSRPLLEAAGVRFAYTHLNNTNPAVGEGVAADGEVFTV